MEDRVKSIKSFLKKFESKFEDRVNVEINDWEEIKNIVDFFMDNDEGTPIIDFIDLSNWDCVEEYSFNDSSRELNLTWHDYDRQEDQIAIEAFGADVLKCVINIHSIVITGNKGMPVVLIKGYYKDQKEINRIYNSGCSDIHIAKNHHFSTVVRKMVKKRIQDITVPNINCFTVSIVPNCARHISPTESKDTMFSYNIKSVMVRLDILVNELGDTLDSDQEKLQTYGNIARKCFENALKIMHLKAGTVFEEDYQKLMLGSLLSVITNRDFEDHCKIKLKGVQDILNICSHDSGVHIDKEELVKAVKYIIIAINWN